MKIKYLIVIMQQFSNTKSLQVPCNPFFNLLNALHQPGKRVLPFTSPERLPASMAVEAALVLPLFLFFSVALMTPMQWLDTQRKVQMVTERYCEDLSLYAYMQEENQGKDSQEEGDREEGNQEDGSQEKGNPEKDSQNKIDGTAIAAGLWLKGSAEKYADGIRVVEASMPDEAGNICFVLEYQEKVPFFSALSGVTLRAAAQRRSWIGLDGKLRAGMTEEDESGRGEETVYVGANMGRYHLYRDCHYISNQYKLVSVSEAGAMSTSHGNRITACSVCAKNCRPEDKVYITGEGEHYHTTKSCRSMICYVREVPLEEVRHLGVCSYCSGRG